MLCNAMNTATGAAGQLFTMLLQTVMATPCNLTSAWPRDEGEELDSGENELLNVLFVCIYLQSFAFFLGIHSHIVNQNKYYPLFPF